MKRYTKKDLLKLADDLYEEIKERYPYPENPITNDFAIAYLNGKKDAIHDIVKYGRLRIEPKESYL